MGKTTSSVKVASPQSKQQQRKKGATKRLVAPPTPEKRFSRKEKAAESIRERIKTLKRAARNLPEEEDAPVLAKELFTRLSNKEESALTWTLVSQHLPGLWSDKRCQFLDIEASDLTSESVPLIAKCFTHALNNGYGEHTDKKAQLSLDELSEMDGTLEEISLAAVKKAAKGRKKGAQHHLASPSNSEGSGRDGSPPAVPVKKAQAQTNRKQAKASVPNDEEVDELDSDEEILPTPTQNQLSKKQSTASKSQSKKGAKGNDANSRSSSRGRTKAEARPEKEYDEGTILLAKLPGGTGDLWWPAAIAVDKGKGAENKRTNDNNHLVSLIPTHELYWVPPKSLKAIQGSLRAVPDDLVASEAREYEEAIELLKNKNADALQEWLDADQEDE